MATVEKNDRITVMKYNNIDRIDIQIDDGKNYVELTDADVRFLFMLLAKWCVEEMAG